MATGCDKKVSSNDIIDKLNIKNAKIIAVCLVLFFSVFHGYRHLGYDVNSCTLIMSDGRYNGKKDWQPYGCMMHNYSQIDTKRCFRLHHFIGNHNHFVFIGDSRLFQLYAAFLRTINKNVIFKHNQTQSYSDNLLGLQVDYVYNPSLSVPFDVNVTKWKRKKIYPSIVVLGFGINNTVSFKLPPDHLKHFKENLTRLIPTFDMLAEKKVKVIWTLQELVKVKMKNIKTKILNNSLIDLYNNAAVEVLKISQVDILVSTRKLSAPFLEDMEDGFTLTSEHIAKRTGAQILLNVYCNDHMNFQDGSCCSTAEQYTQLQIITFSVLFLCLFLGTVAIIHDNHKNRKRPISLMKSSQSDSEFKTVSLALAKLALIMGYFYICDRTTFFMKETKHFSQSAFWIPSVYLLCVGLFFTEDSGHLKILHRDQTDEWKGWMQLVLLIYHWTNAQKVLPLFLLSRVIISAYVFLSGYGHFFYFWQSGDGSIFRFFRVSIKDGFLLGSIYLLLSKHAIKLFNPFMSTSPAFEQQSLNRYLYPVAQKFTSSVFLHASLGFMVLFRLNFMQFVVCLCMNRPYQSYEFLPLISFWYVLMHVFLVLPPRITALSSENNPIQYLYLVFKFVFFFGIITTLYMSEVFFEKIFVTRPWKALFVTTDDDITLWWTGWKRERYGVLCGMVFSAVLLLAHRFNLVDHNSHTYLFSNGISLFVALVSFIGIGCYIAFAFLCRDWSQCIEIHSYATFLPIIGYVILRNISGVLRSRYSTFFAWFGKISLELCVGQFHIWLAADLNGTLILLPKYTNLNLFLTSFIFVCAAHEIHEITNTLLPYAVPLNLYSLSRNVLLLAAILVPIGIHAGMF